MKRKQLGNSELCLSSIMLGSMTWGEQNSAQEGWQQIDYALEHGVNCIDTAELYAIPPKADTYGRTELIIGEWLARSGRRHDVILASKVCGPTDWCPHIREGKAHLDAENIIAACDASLKRLQTDHIDLYQTHWPDRSTNYFGKRGYQHQREAIATPIDETLSALEQLIAAGKVRYIGVSNETPWGVMQHLHLARELGHARIVSIQNPYNLLNRSFEIGLAEVACREDVGLLAYSPLAFGVLSGKYLHQQKPEGSRLALFERYTRYANARGMEATEAYVGIARRHGHDPARMALAYILLQPFVVSAIIGATTMAQLKSNIASADLILSSECIEEIEAVHKSIPNPCP